LPKAHLPEFRQRAVNPSEQKPASQIEADPGISGSCLRRLMDIADLEDGHKPSLNSDERSELIRFRRKKRAPETESLKPASAYFDWECIDLRFAGREVLPGSGGSGSVFSPGNSGE
jgi:transposase